MILEGRFEIQVDLNNSMAFDQVRHYTPDCYLDYDAREDSSMKFMKWIGNC